MNCQEVRLRLEAFHDRAADAELSSRIAEHLEGCSSCDGALAQLRALRTLLLKSSIPAPSATLARGLMEAFHQEHKQTAKTIPWWRKAFGSSITVPAPALAAAMIVIAIGIAAANIIGRNAAIASLSDATSAVSTSVPPPPSISPEIIERTKFVEVPVVEERVVTKVIYVERENKNIQTEKLKSSDSKQKSPNNKGRENSEMQTAANPDLKMSGEVAENGYFTRTDLSGFRPESVIKAKIIREGKNDEK